MHTIPLVTRIREHILSVWMGRWTQLEVLSPHVPSTESAVNEFLIVWPWNITISRIPSLKPVYLFGLAAGGPFNSVLLKFSLLALSFLVQYWRIMITGSDTAWASNHHLKCCMDEEVQGQYRRHRPHWKDKMIQNRLLLLYLLLTWLNHLQLPSQDKISHSYRE